MVRHISVCVEVKAYPDMVVNVDSLMVAIMVSIMVADTMSVMVMDRISDTAAIRTQAMAATTIWHTMDPTTPILELSTTRQGLTFRW
jgi:hypothetical protein